MKNLLLAVSTVLFVLLIATALASALAVTALEEKDNGTEIQVKPGAIIELSLPEQGGTGYLWEFDRLDGQHFEVLKTETRPLAEPPRVGGTLLRTWRLKVKNAGESQLVLDYLRPWEGKGKAVKHFQVKVLIR